MGVLAFISVIRVKVVAGRGRLPLSWQLVVGGHFESGLSQAARRRIRVINLQNRQRRQKARNSSVVVDHLVPNGACYAPALTSSRAPISHRGRRRTRA